MMNRGAEVTMRLAVVSFIIACFFTIRAALGGDFLLKLQESSECIANFGKSNEQAQQFIPKLVMSVMQCKAQNKINLENCKSFWLQYRSDISSKESEDCKCFLLCIATKLNWMKDGILQWDELNNISQFFENEKCSKQVRTLSGICQQQVVSEGCEGAHELIRCFSDNLFLIKTK